VSLTSEALHEPAGLYSLAQRAAAGTASDDLDRSGRGARLQRPVYAACGAFVSVADPIRTGKDPGQRYLNPPKPVC